MSDTSVTFKYQESSSFTGYIGRVPISQPNLLRQDPITSITFCMPEFLLSVDGAISFEYELKEEPGPLQYYNLTGEQIFPSTYTETPGWIAGYTPTTVYRNEFVIKMPYKKTQEDPESFQMVVTFKK